MSTCRNCLRKREVFQVSRFGGGTYRRGGRHYRSSICLECAKELLTYCGPNTTQYSRYDVSGLRRAVEILTRIENS